MNGSERPTWVVMASMVCLWVIWEGWAAFFLWLTSWSTISNSAMLSDFSNLYSQGKWWLSRAYANPGTHAFTYPYAYPPSSLPLFGFFAQYDFGVAAQLWTGLGLGVFLVAVLSVAYTLKPSRRYLFLSFAAVLFFTSFGVRAELQLGQINMLLVGLTILSLTAHRSNHTYVSATLVAAGTFLKGPPVLFLIYFVVFHRDLGYLVHFLESAAAILGISFLVIPIQLYWIWFTNVFPTLFTGWGLAINESAFGPIAVQGFSYLTPGLFVLGVCVFVGFAYWAYPISFRKRRFQSSVLADAMFLMNAIIILVLGTRSWPQDYVWVILPLALFLSSLLVVGAKSWYFMLVGLAAALFNFSPYPLFVYYLSYYYATMGYYFPRIGVIPTGLIGDLLMAPTLLLLFVRPQAILRKYTPRASNA